MSRIAIPATRPCGSAWRAGNLRADHWLEERQTKDFYQTTRGCADAQSEVLVSSRPIISRHAQRHPRGCRLGADVESQSFHVDGYQFPAGMPREGYPVEIQALWDPPAAVSWNARRGSRSEPWSALAEPGEIIA